MYRKILVPLDGSWRAERILRHVEVLAINQQSQVIFLRVLEPFPPMIDPHETRLNLYFEEIKRQEEEARQYLAGQQGEFRAKGIDAIARVVQGPVVKTILDTAQAEEVDLIAMASHGRSGLANIFYGSVALGVLHRADRPLLLVRSGFDRPGEP